ncbi:MAG: tol-pal system protein YbgF [Oxalobacter sp.]|nr:tol-pal system protein YbgF [Oxalobacter sp.]
MRNNVTRIAAALLACSAWFAVQDAHAFFEDDEARRHILDLREKKADKSSLIELQSQNDALKQEIADLRGQIEVLTQKTTEMESRQKDFYLDLDDRLRRLEGKPPAARVKPDGEEGAEEAKADSGPKDPPGADKPADLSVNTEEADYEVAEKRFKAGNYKGAIAVYSRFIQKYPDSHRLGHAYYQLGNAYYLQKDYKNAYRNQSIILKRFPRNPVAPDAMLNMATCQIGMNNVAGAKKTLTDLTKNYPASNAAKRAKSILSQL